MTDQRDDPSVPGQSPRIRRRKRLRARARGAVPFVGGIFAALIAVLVFTAVNPGPRALTAADIRAGVASALASLTPPPARAQVVYDIIRPSLVLIETNDRAPDPTPSPAAPAASVAPVVPPPNPDPSPSAAPAPGPAGPPPAADTPRTGLGSGVVINEDGDILTSLHVVDGARSITVTFADGSRAPATITAAEQENDIAVISTGGLPDGVTPATLGNPGSLRIGSEAFVVGNPFGLYGSISSGVVSGLDRTFTIRDGSQTLSGLIQVDAAVNPGNSGGPLLDRNGLVVGVVAALLNPTSQDVFVGIGLAVPIDVAGGAAGLPPY